jgi:hypothetical protein
MAHGLPTEMLTELLLHRPVGADAHGMRGGRPMVAVRMQITAAGRKAIAE